jgi:hypothetical protein
MKEVATALGRSLMVVNNDARRAVTEVKAQKVDPDQPITGPVTHWCEINGRMQRGVTEEDLEAYRQYLANRKTSGGGQSADGMKWYKVRLTKEKAEELAADGFSLKSAFNYDPERNKAYRLKRAKAAGKVKDLEPGGPITDADLDDEDEDEE